MMREDFLDSLGHKVVDTVETVEAALARIDQGGFDVAIVDVHLKGGEKVWPVADRLDAVGCQFVLATGGHVEPPPAQYAAVPVLAKPSTLDAIDTALSAPVRQEGRQPPNQTGREAVREREGPY